MNAAARKQYLTVAQANQRLPLVRAIVQDIQQLYREVQERRERLARLRKRPGARQREERDLHGEELDTMEEELQKDIDRLQTFVEELEQLGAELKDPEQGLIDFLALAEGREIYLCWRLGEDDIAYWHELDAGFAGRQSLMEGSFPMSDAGEELQ